VQISTRTLDAVVDVIKLRGQMIALQDVFTNPAVVKVNAFSAMLPFRNNMTGSDVQVLHGCRCDVVWLQRDFGLYLVNVFDTGEAARVLNYPSLGLAHLLETFCKVKAQKQFQARTTCCYLLHPFAVVL
jgi:exosome complex exonuclease RRP6